MPEIASVLPSSVAAPVLPAAASAQPQPADSGSAGPNFLAQLKTALISLTNVVAPHPSTPLVDSHATADAQGASTGDAQSTSAGGPLASKAVDHTSEVLPEMLAALGFMLVPVAFQAAVPPATSTSGSANPSIGSDANPAPAGHVTAQPHQPQLQPRASLAAVGQPQSQLTAVGALGQPQSQLTAVGALGQPQSQPATSPAASQLGVQPAAFQQPAPDVLAHASVQPAPADLQPLLAMRAPAAAAIQPNPNSAPVAPPSTPPSPVAQAAITPAPEPAVATQPTAPTAPTAPAPSATAPTVLAGQQRSQDGGSSPNTGNGGSARNSSSHSTRPISSASHATTLDAAVTPDQTLAVAAAAAAAAAAPTPVPAPSMADQVLPTAVVSQIAHQADLYRLPGNRGVRIQLHPDGLGGVQVTVNYGASGGIELHINAEHASTGALVQAGWSELRDALAAQGISPDRLVMSVSAPNAASPMESSNGGGGSGYRSDAGLAGFSTSSNNNNNNNNQGQSNQPGGEQQRAPRGWSGGPDPISPGDDTSRVTSVLANSRIDYRV